MGAFSLGQIAPNISAFSTAKAAAARIYSVIDRVPEIDTASNSGATLNRGTTAGRIEFKAVTFAYPSRPNQNILQGLNLTIEPGERVAFVGESGCGKSTILQLLQRFYDPQSGSVEIDGVSLKDYNLTSLRNAFGVVAQEPVLFSLTVAENIALGTITDAFVE